MFEKIKPYFEKLKLKTKRAWRSATIWFNSSGLVLLEVMANYPDLEFYLTDKGLMSVWLIGNIILRYKTNTALEER